MPRPPVIATIDWSSVFAQAKDYRQWLAAAEFPEHVAQMEDARASLQVPETIVKRIGALGREVPVLAFAEDWCGDVVRHVPALERLAELSPRIKTRYLAREDRPDAFVRFLTNGGEAVPKFVFFGKGFVECGNWGPMESAARTVIARGKACGDVGAARKKVAEIYRADPGLTTVFEELTALFELAAAEAP